jgi:hypothetical protein
MGGQNKAARRSAPLSARRHRAIAETVLPTGDLTGHVVMSEVHDRWVVHRYATPAAGRAMPSSSVARHMAA